VSAGAIVPGCYVKSADGVVYRVSYTDTISNLATVWPQDQNASNTIELPVSELTRIVDPARRKVPIEGMPDVRPHCQNCDKPLRPWSTDERDGRRIVRRVFLKWNSYAGLFCTLRCSLRFAEAAHRAGYRIVKKGGRS
jgi:hypothetical protein